MPRFSCVLFLPSGWSSSFVRMDRNMERWKFVTAWWCEGSIPALPMSGRNDGWCRACLACIFNEEEGESKSRFLTPRVNHQPPGFFTMFFYCRSQESIRWCPTCGTMTKGERETHAHTIHGMPWIYMPHSIHSSSFPESVYVGKSPSLHKKHSRETRVAGSETTTRIW